jgi:hypothetical protein
VSGADLEESEILIEGYKKLEAAVERQAVK